MKNYKISLLSCLCLFSILFFGCTHEDRKLPKVKTGNVFFVSNEYFGAGALVEANGAGVIKFGICYSTTNNKPDINDAHTDELNNPTIADYGLSPLGGSDHQAFVSINDSGEELYAATVYVRAYAMTTDGQYVYGNIVSCNRDDENTPLGKLKRPANGWILQSASIPMNEIPNGFSVLDNDQVSLFWFSDYLLDFHKGSTECLAAPSRLFDGYKILYLSKNELQVEVAQYDYGVPIGTNLVYVPAP